MVSQKLLFNDLYSETIKDWRALVNRSVPNSLWVNMHKPQKTGTVTKVFPSLEKFRREV